MVPKANLGAKLVIKFLELLDEDLGSGNLNFCFNCYFHFVLNRVLLYSPGLPQVYSHPPALVPELYSLAGIIGAFCHTCVPCCW